ncbi:CoA transferase [Rhodopila sp.]|uniref:CaiB/BaiF CoA-transferase family protein n=1 Tax=Rhodopila sp. TaxID=2480087 RepID=UPI003D09EA5B
MTVLSGFRVLQIGPGLAAAVCGRLLADVGATVTRIDPDRGTPLADHLNRDPSPPPINDDAWAAADMIVCQGSPATLRRTGRDIDSLRGRNARAAVVLISPFGQTGPQAEHPATDLTLMFESGIARMLTGQVDDLNEPPMRPVGEQSAFLGGLAAACAGMHAALGSPAATPNGTRHAGSVVDVSIHEALATLAITELARAGQKGRTHTDKSHTDKSQTSKNHTGKSQTSKSQTSNSQTSNSQTSNSQTSNSQAGNSQTSNSQTSNSQTGKSWSRQRVADGNGATVCILPTSDGHAAISPREDRQWAAWLQVMGSPPWGSDPRFATRQRRVANWDTLHALMSDWSRNKPKAWIATTAQAAHVPSFALCEPAEHLASPHLRHRGFFRLATLVGQNVQIPSSPFGLHLTPACPADPPPITGPLPLSGLRVLDFSWVIAGPTATRYLAAMGAEVIKIEAPAGDPGRASELHTVLGQAKQSIVLNLKHPEAVAIAKTLVAGADVLVENFATGVMDRLGLGPEALRAINPRLIYVSASGLGRDGPESHTVAYGTLLQCYAGFAGLNRHEAVPPRVGMAWLDPMCGLMLAFITAASLWARRCGAIARVDFSMLEAMLWTMAEPLLSAQLPATPAQPPYQPPAFAVYRTAGADDWLAVDPAPETRPGEPDAAKAAALLTCDGTAAAALARSADLVDSEHLQARYFWYRNDTGVLPGLPWRASFGRATGPAPALGADTNAVLSRILGLSPEAIRHLRDAGALEHDRTEDKVQGA